MTAPPESVESFRSFDLPGHVKIAFNLCCADRLLTLETRVVGTDARSRRTFAAYWFVIWIGSGVMRRVWLRAISRRAESR